MGAPHPTPAAGRGARAGAHRRRCRGSSSPACAGATSASTSRRPRCTSSTGSSRAGRPTTSPPTCCRRRCSTSGRWPWRSSSTSSGRCCSSCSRSWCAARAAASSALALGALVASSFVVVGVVLAHLAAARPSSPRRPGSGSSASGPCSPSPSPAGRGRRTPARGSAALGWAALAALVAVALWLPQDIDWPGAWALLPTLPTAVLLWVGWQGPARGPVRVLGTAPMVWVGGLSYSIYLWHWPVIILGGWTADAFGATLPAWGVVAARARLGRARVAVVALRRVADPPRPVAARPPAGAARRRAGPVLRRRARRPAAVRAALALHHDAARRHPAAVVAARRRDAAAGPAASSRSTTPAGSPPTRWSRARTGRRPTSTTARCPSPPPTPVACTFGDPQGATTVALVGDSKAMQWLPALEEAAATRGWRVVTYGKSSCAFSDAPAAQAGAAYPQCDAWNARGHGRPARRSARRRRHLRAWPASAWTGSGTERPPRSSTATPRAGRPSRMPVCRSSSSATARSRPTTSTCAPRGTRPS